MPCLKSVLATAAFAYLTSAETIQVTATSDNTFDPDTIAAKKGDVVEFHFEGKNHSVAAGNYKLPCTPLNLDDNSTFFSAYVPTNSGEADKVFRITIEETTPLVFYSTQGNECAEGMVGIINQSANVTLADYKQRASVLSQSVAPRNEPFGGEFADNNGSASSSQTGSSAKPTSSGSSGSGSGSGSGSSSDSSGKDGDHKNAASAAGGAHMAGLLGVALLAAWAAQA